MIRTNHIWQLLILFGAIYSVGAVILPSPSMAQAYHYQLKIDSVGYEHTIIVNGISFVQSSGEFVTPYLRHGKNSIQITYRRLSKWTPVWRFFGEDMQQLPQGFSIRLLKIQRLSRFPDFPKPEPKEFFAYTTEGQDVPLEVSQQKAVSLDLQLRGSGRSYYELIGRALCCKIEMSVNKRFPFVLNKTVVNRRVPFDVLQVGENSIQVTTRSVAGDAKKPRWTVTLYQLWEDGGFEPKAHLEASQPTAGLMRTTQFGITELPSLKPLAKQAVERITAADRKVLTTLVREFYSAYKTRNAEEIFKLERQALLNTWERLGVSAEAQAHALKSLVARRKDNFKSSWKLAPLPKELVFSLQDGLVKISAKDPLIAVSIGESGYLYRTALYFAKDAGRWRIVKFDWAIPQ